MLPQPDWYCFGPGLGSLFLQMAAVTAETHGYKEIAMITVAMQPKAQP